MKANVMNKHFNKKKQKTPILKKQIVGEYTTFLRTFGNRQLVSSENAGRVFALVQLVMSVTCLVYAGFFSCLFHI